MEFKIIAISTLIILFILNFLLVAYTTLYKRKIIIRDITKNLSLFSPMDLKRKMESYSLNVKKDEEILKLKTRISEITLRDFKTIEKKIKSLNQYTSLKKIFKSINFYTNLKEIIKDISEYEKNYLEERFKLFDLTSDIEIENAILLKLKEKTSDVSVKIYDSKINRINDSKKINLKINKIRSGLKKLEDEKNNQTRHLSIPFVKDIKRVDNTIQSIFYDMKFIEDCLKILDGEIRESIKNVVNFHKENKEDLLDIDEKVSHAVLEVKLLKKEINNDIDELKHKNVSNNLTLLNKKITELDILIRSNIDFTNFVEKNNFIVDLLLKFVHENHILFVSEIKRHKTENEFERLMSIDNAVRSFEDSVTKYEKEKISQFEISTPENMSSLILNIVNTYEEYINVVTNNVKDISNINSKVNDINCEVALMNTWLLQIEQNINGLQGELKAFFEKGKDELQKKVFSLKKGFKDNGDTINNKTFEEAKELKKTISEMVSKTKGLSFELFFLKEVIMILNKYRGEDKALDLMMTSLEESYKDEEIDLSIRKAKEIIEMHGIKE